MYIICLLVQRLLVVLFHALARKGHGGVWVCVLTTSANLFLHS